MDPEEAASQEVYIFDDGDIEEDVYSHKQDKQVQQQSRTQSTVNPSQPFLNVQPIKTVLIRPKSGRKLPDDLEDASKQVQVYATTTPEAARRKRSDRNKYYTESVETAAAKPEEFEIGQQKTKEQQKTYKNYPQHQRFIVHKNEEEEQRPSQSPSSDSPPASSPDVLNKKALRREYMQEEAVAGPEHPRKMQKMRPNYSDDEEDQQEVSEGEQADQVDIPKMQSTMLKLKPVPEDNLSADSSKANVSPPQILKIKDIKEFIHSPLPPGIVLSCVIVKEKNSIVDLQAKYSVYAASERRLLMTTKKLAAKTSSIFLISTIKENISTRNKNYQGKLKANFGGTEWILYDSGSNPEQTRELDQSRRHLVTIGYEFNMFGMNGPRKMEVVIPKVDSRTNKAVSVRPLENKNILKELQQQNSGKTKTLINKAPSFDEKEQVFILDFKGKVKEPSVKNFILVQSQYNRECLVFGKQTETEYLMEVKHPLSPIQAFGICLSSLDRKFFVQ